MVGLIKTKAFFVPYNKYIETKAYVVMIGKYSLAEQ